MAVGVSEVAVKENPMRTVKVSKVVLNIGVGRSGEMIERAKKVLTDLTGREPASKNAKQTIKEFGIQKGEPIGVTVTLRGPKALEVLKRLLAAKDNKIGRGSFDKTGNCSFGIKEHIEIPNVKYDPAIGIFGMDASVVLERGGYRVARRRRAASRVGSKHRVTDEDAVEYFVRNLKVEVV